MLKRKSLTSLRLFAGILGSFEGGASTQRQRSFPVLLLKQDCCHCGSRLPTCGLRGTRQRLVVLFWFSSFCMLSRGHGVTVDCSCWCCCFSSSAALLSALMRRGTAEIQSNRHPHIMRIVIYTCVYICKWSAHAFKHIRAIYDCPATAVVNGSSTLEGGTRQSIYRGAVELVQCDVGNGRLRSTRDKAAL